MKTAVCDDDVTRIKEFHAQGYGRKTISDYMGISEYAVKRVLEGKRPTVSSELSIRQRGELINNAFGPVR